MIPPVSVKIITNRDIRNDCCSVIFLSLHYCVYNTHSFVIQVVSWHINSRIRFDDEFFCRHFFSKNLIERLFHNFSILKIFRLGLKLKYIQSKFASSFNNLSFYRIVFYIHMYIYSERFIQLVINFRLGRI